MPDLQVDHGFCERTLLEGPDPADLPFAQGALRIAIQVIKTTPLGPDAAMAEQAILGQVVSQNRQFLCRTAVPHSLKRGAPLSGPSLAGRCGSASEDLWYRLRSLLGDNDVKGVDVFFHQAEVAFGAGGHAFLVVHFLSGRSYLLDTTFRQFFLSQDHLIGGYMRSQAGGNQLADLILRQGYCLLTDASANLYGRSFHAEEGPVPGDLAFTQADLLATTDAPASERAAWRRHANQSKRRPRDKGL